MRKNIALAAGGFLLAGCQANYNYQRIGYGPELHVAQAQCEILAMGTERGVIAYGSPEYVLGAQLGNAMANGIRADQFMKNCMVLQGWGRVPNKPGGTTVASVAKPKISPSYQQMQRDIARRKARGEKWPAPPKSAL